MIIERKKRRINYVYIYIYVYILIRTVKEFIKKDCPSALLNSGLINQLVFFNHVHEKYLNKTT